MLLSAEKLDIKLPRISSINNMLKASEIIYGNFGDLYDIPLFAFEGVKDAAKYSQLSVDTVSLIISKCDAF